MTFFSTLLVPLVLLASSAPADPERPAPPHPVHPTLAADRPVHRDALSPLRELYFRSVRSADALRPAFDELERLRATPPTAADRELEGVLTAYRGALLTLQAKHAPWPHQKLRYVREGFAVLDDAVAAHPEIAEVRYLRLMSGYYLPSFFGRGGSVREDFAALARLLPSAADRYPPDLYQAIVRFVLEHGEPRPAERARLQAAADRVG